MGNVKIVTDSGSDVSAESVVNHAVRVVPLSVHIDGEDFKDGVNLSKADFYRRLADGFEKLHTAQPSPADFVKAYEDALQEGSEVICINLSSELSGTHQSAVLATTMVHGKVTVFDSRSASVGTGLMVRRAVEMAESGAASQEILAELDRMREETRVFFLVDTLEYLQRNGRIGRAQALLGTMLRIKPILGLQDGVVVPVEKIRGGAKALRRMVELFTQEMQGKSASVAVAQGAEPGRAEELRVLLEKTSVQVDALYIDEVGPTIGAHAGPGIIGFAFCPTGEGQ